MKKKEERKKLKMKSTHYSRLNHIADNILKHYQTLWLEKFNSCQCNDKPEACLKIIIRDTRIGNETYQSYTKSILKPFILNHIIDYSMASKELLDILIKKLMYTLNIQGKINVDIN
jgi:hypothetical protein